MTLTLQTSWSSAHFYKNQKWSYKENREHFGRCFSEFGHGHDYKLEVSFEILEKELHNQTSNESDELIEQLQKVILDLRETLDHQHLNFVIPTFKEQIPTTENLALFCQQQVQQKITQQQLEVTLSLVRLFETPELWVELRSME